jgi:hypothetical protein
MFERFFTKKTIPQVSTQPIAEQPAVQEQEPIPQPKLIVPNTVVLRAKKWVRINNTTGIIVGADSSGYIKVDVVNEIGETMNQVRVPAGTVRLARYMEIPAPRRGDQAKAATLGYV